MVSEPIDPNATLAGSSDSGPRQFMIKLAIGIISSIATIVFESQIKGPWATWARPVALLGCERLRYIFSVLRAGQDFAGSRRGATRGGWMLSCEGHFQGVSRDLQKP